MARHSVREVKSTFEDILGENTRVLSELDKTISYTQSDIDSVNELYTRALDKFVTGQLRPMNSEMLTTLSGLTGGRRDFEQEYNRGLVTSREAEIRLNGLTTTHGTETALRAQYKQRITESEKLEGEVAVLDRTTANLARTLAPVDAFNAHAEKIGKGHLKLDAEGVDYFSSKKGIAHVWAWLTDWHYHQGRELVKSFAKQGKQIPAVQQELADSKALRAEKGQRVSDIGTETTGMTAVLKDMRSTAEKVVSDTSLREKMKKDIMTSFDDQAFFSRAVKALGKKFPVFVVEQRAKLDNLRKLQTTAQKSRQTVQQAGGKLDKHMYKLRRAASRSGSTQITIDLQGIKTGFSQMQTGVRTQTTQLRQTSASVRDYKYDSSASSTAYGAGGVDPLMVMTVIMLSDIQHTPMPDFSAAIDSAAGSFNAASDALSGGIDAGGLSGLDAIGNMDVSVPDISVSVPDISVPDISVPDFSSYDGGGFSGGGYDGGGGFSGGFD